MRPFLLPFLTLLVTLTGCASLPKLSGDETLAVVSFTFDKAVSQVGKDSGAGPAFLSSSDYYKNHQAALDATWAEFKAQLPPLFAGRKVVDIGQIEGNEALLAATAPTKSSFLGMESSSDDSYLSPAGLHGVDLARRATVQAVAAAVPADLLVSVSLKAFYDLTADQPIGSVGGRPAQLVLQATVTVVRADGSPVRTAVVSARSRQTAAMQTFGDRASRLPTEDLPRLVQSAFAALLPVLTAEVARW